jgi:hypothetical protein
MADGGEIFSKRRPAERAARSFHIAIVGAVASCLACGDTGSPVVDPTPPPARCVGSPPDNRASASLVAAADGELEIMILLGNYSANTASYVDAAPTVDVGRVVYWRVTAEGLEVRLRGEGVVNATIPIRCADGGGALIARVTVPVGSEAGNALPVELRAQY